MSNLKSFRTWTGSKLGIALLASGALYGYGFSSVNLWPLCLLYPIALGFAWVEKPNTKHLKLYTWLSGLFLMLATTSWMLELNSGAWSLPGEFELKAFIALIWVTSGLIWSTGFLALPYIYRYLSCMGTSIETRYLMFSVAFVLSEWFRSVVFSAANYGNGSSLGADWSFGAFGLAATSTGLIYTSRIVGLFGLSLASLSVTFGIFIFIRRNRSKVSLSMILVPILVATVGFNLPKDKSPLEYAVTIVHKPYIEGTIQTINTGLPEGYSPPSTNRQLVVLPEYSSIFQDGLNDSDKKFVQTLSGNVPTNFIDVVLSRTNLGKHNEIGLYSAGGEKLDSQKKNFLIPGGEYLPYYAAGLMNISGNSSVLQSFNNISLITKSPQKPRAFTLGNEKIGALACSSIISPDQYRQLVNDGAGILINSADLGVFYDAKSYYQQNIQFAKFLSASNSRPLVQAARQGVSLVADIDGNIVDYLEISEDLQVRSYNLDTNSKKTPYTIFGEWLTWVSLLPFLYILIRKK